MLATTITAYGQMEMNRSNYSYMRMTKTQLLILFVTFVGVKFSAKM